MRLTKLITGVNAEGKSCIIEEEVLEPATVAGMTDVAVASLFRTQETPPPVGPPQFGHLIDTHLPPGHVSWSVVQHAPRELGDDATASSTMHYSHSLDMMLVVAGSTTMVLDTVERELLPGDCVVMNGIDHAMVAGPQGSTMLVAKVGTQLPTS
jgi:mannose-6-phosphate isomerase-like protein (cupin superfamily)